MKQVELKPVAEQAIVILGASSGIGLCTARLAAARGARVFLVARNARDLEEAVAEIRSLGGRAECMTGDVANEADVEAVGEAAIRAFGQIDTWVNNAGVGVYGRAVEVPMEDLRRQFDVNYWGTVHGCRVAVRYLQERGGAIINVASALADRAIPLQANYCATKHAVKAFTDALRMELEEEWMPISVSLIKPGSMDTPLFEKARTYLDVEPRPIAPVFDPELTARAILACAERPIRDLSVGGQAKFLGVAANVAPRMTDRYMERTSFAAQGSARPVRPARADNLEEPVPYDGGERGGNYDGRVKGTSLYTSAALHPGAVGFVIGAAALAFGVRAWRRNGGH